MYSEVVFKTINKNSIVSTRYFELFLERVLVLFHILPQISQCYSRPAVVVSVVVISHIILAGICEPNNMTSLTWNSI